MKNKDPTIISISFAPVPIKSLLFFFSIAFKICEVAFSALVRALLSIVVSGILDDICFYTGGMYTRGIDICSGKVLRRLSVKPRNANFEVQ